LVQSQPGILAPLASHGRFLTFCLAPGTEPSRALATVASLPVDEGLVVGIGGPLLPKARPFTALVGPGVSAPSTQGALWFCIRGDDPGDVLLRSRALAVKLGPAFRVDEDVIAFKHREGRDLSGFVDGTENPDGDEAVTTAIARDGASFVSIQRWAHDLAALERMAPSERDLAIGRRLSDNEEIDDAPPSAHVKRSAQESFSPEAFMVRRSMPYGDLREHGLYFVAYAASLDPFERVLRRMMGLEDGVVDALFRFTRPVSGGNYWCPPVREGRLAL
jgi:putative iron-dependent peroxidase